MYFWQHCSDTQQWLHERDDHVIGAEGAAYKARHRPGAGTIEHGQACGKYMATILEHSVYVFNIMVVKLNVNIACYTLHFVTINESVCTKPLQ
jgi:hypothetical protein